MRNGITRRLVCSCCGGDAGRWQQHWNRDTGYGVCVPCVSWMRMRGTSEEEINNDYGAEGINWGMTVEVYGRTFRVLAAFQEVDNANAWMLRHDGHALIATLESGLHLIAHEDDKGLPTTSEAVQS